MVYISKPVLVAAIVIAPTLAAPVGQFSKERAARGNNFQRAADGPAEVDTRALDRERLKKLAHTAGKILDGVGIASTVASLIKPSPPPPPPNGPRDYQEELDSRAFDKERLKRLAGRILDGVDTAATVASIFKPSLSPRSPLDSSAPLFRREDEIEQMGLEARISPVLWDTGSKAFAGLAAGAGLGAVIAPLFKKPKNPASRRSFSEGDYDLFNREFDATEDVLFERYFDDDELFGREFEEDEIMSREFYERSSVPPSSVVKMGDTLGRLVKYIVPAVGLGGVGLGIQAAHRTRSLDERDGKRGLLDELD